MLLPGPSSKLGGATLVAIGLGWLLGVRTRLLAEARRRFWPISLAVTTVVALPIMVLPTAALWWVATPHALNPWFAVAWASVWLAAVVVLATVSCPDCGRPHARSGHRLRVRADGCVHCGAGALEADR